MPHDDDNDDSLNPADEQLCALLDRYVAASETGETHRRLELLKDRPELAGLIECLDTLDSLAPAAAARARSSDFSETVIMSGDLSANEDDLLFELNLTTAMSSVPRHFGRYELLEEIGRGGMGVVFKARQKELDRIVALKMILSSQLASAEEIRRFHVEARAAGSLRHAHIVGIHEAGQINGQHYFTMDFVSGKSLSQHLREGPLEPDDAASCLADVARAVDYLHTRNIVHRDLKPSNILLDEQKRPFVSDFGLAKVSVENEAATQTGMIAGTPSYMAPEQAAGKQHEITPQTDVYSLGAILYEMLTGRPPFKEATPLDTLVQVLEGEPTLPNRINRHVPRELEWICLKCLEKNPGSRYASAAALADDLDKFLRREPTDARPSGIVQKVRRWARREPALASRLATLGAAVTITQATFMFSAERDPAYHVQIMTVFAAWAFACLFFQRLLNNERTANFARFAWSATDAEFLTLQLYLVISDMGPLLIGYPLLITASGLFFRVRLVAFMSAVCMLSFGLLVAIRPDEAPEWNHSLLFAIILAIIGFIVGYQVYRVRALSRYYERRPLV